MHLHNNPPTNSTTKIPAFLPVTLNTAAMKASINMCRISSAKGKYKAFSTNASHLSIVSLFFCTSLGGTLALLLLPAQVYCLGDAHSGHTHAETFHLQSEKQRHKGGSEKTLCWWWVQKKPFILDLKKCPWLQSSKFES